MRAYRQTALRVHTPQFARDLTLRGRSRRMHRIAIKIRGRLLLSCSPRKFPPTALRATSLLLLRRQIASSQSLIRLLARCSESIMYTSFARQLYVRSEEDGQGSH